MSFRPTACPSCPDLGLLTGDDAAHRWREVHPEEGHRGVWYRVDESFDQVVLRLFELEILAPVAQVLLSVQRP